MKGIAFLSGFVSSLFASGIILPAPAQVTSDGTTNTVVTSSGNNFNIIDGIQKGNNLFHSFKEFSIPKGDSAVFNNSLDVVNIINRVTGGNISNIDGLVKANGNANLFLINPAGIVFGENAKLDIGGSFLGSTAQSILFEDGFEFSAVNPQEKPLLTVSVPVGVQMGINPGAIEVNGNGHQLSASPREINRSNNTEGLRVKPGNTLALIGGDINLKGAILAVEEGRIELGSLGKSELASISAIDEGFTFDYTQVVSLGEIRLQEESLVDVSGDSAGAIQVKGGQVLLSDSSLLLSQNQGNQAGGEIRVDATDLLEIAGYNPTSEIRSGVSSETVGTGAGSDITVNTGRLIVREGGGISNQTYATGDSGDIKIQASELVQVKDLNFTSFPQVNMANFLLDIFSATKSTGSGGNVMVSTPQLSLTNGAVIGSVTQGNGIGGSLEIDADTIEISGNNSRRPTVLSTSSLLSGNAGDLKIKTRTLTVRNSGLVSSSAVGQGNAGSVKIDASESVTLTGKVPKARSSSQIRSAVIFINPFFPIVPQGRGGSVIINTPSLNVTDEALVSVANQGIGDAGTIEVNAGSILLNSGGKIAASTASGEGGNIDLQVRESLLLRRESAIEAQATGRAGNGGNLTINSPVIAGFENSDIIANAVAGNGGNINITTQGIFGLEFRDKLTEDSDITASSEFGVSGKVNINNISIDPNSGLTELPVDLADSSQQIASGCSSNPGNSFVATGRGGIPKNPNEQVDAKLIWSDIRDLSASRKPNNNSEITTISNKPAIIEANGFIRNASGEIELVAAQNTPLKTQALNCSGIST
ncbi:filamentous hemagglutinin family N-terminal domain protein [Rivularia sp. PCC 7116]|uniref:filamentous hemagglutinin N-terminal domain-containing protein n=1 Tax=Rivularia sp. PCC 7116 TaxID=373994 RepID=UPI00029EDEB9|nr:filamentous hemagglutinin N-terminal domain-containing protein [Rivularia sp. PCC 7116]AFY54834.1 filamentous hemagglutinin family N-terminal domain protein [Rivularia sp. PCC 7116]